MRKNILFLQIYGGGGITGGTEIYLKNLLKELRRRHIGGKFYVVSFNKKNSIFADLTDRVDDSPVTRFMESWHLNNFLYRYPVVGFLASVWSAFFLYRAAERVIKEN